MATETSTHGSWDDHDVMASVDQDRYVIADVSEDGAWLAMGAADAPTLVAWR